MNSSLDDPTARLAGEESTATGAFAHRAELPPERSPELDSPNVLFRMPCNFNRYYEVSVVEGLLTENCPALPHLLKDSRALVVTTPTVHRLYGEAFQRLVERHDLSVKTTVLDCHEENKALALVEDICEQALRYDLSRRGLLIAFGGGICSDIVTVAASLIRRGIAHLRIPTTLIGQVDAGVGIKGAVNFRGQKSYLGCFCPPSAVLLDSSFLETLPPQHLRNGIAEIIKIAIVRDAELFDLITNHSSALLTTGFQQPGPSARRVLRLAASRMLEELQPNLYENQTYERLVDLGHTFSPMIEAASGFTVPHGEAVAVDMALSATISTRLGFLSRVDDAKIINALTAAGLPVFSNLLTPESCLRALKESASHRGGAVNLVLPTAIGRARFLQRLDDLPPHVLAESIEHLARLAEG